jgi:hypothetical protein
MMAAIDYSESETRHEYTTGRLHGADSAQASEGTKEKSHHRGAVGARLAGDHPLSVNACTIARRAGSYSASIRTQAEFR